MSETARSLRVASLFSGIGALDLGLERSGHRLVEACEYWEPARRVMAHHYPHVPLQGDVRTFNSSRTFDLLAAGFPCVDLSHAGAQTGIFGPQSGLVKHAFRVAAETQPEWILLENVPNLLRLQRGAGIQHIVESVESLGYRWAYRVVDSRAFGVPQRRNRVIFLASKRHDPAAALLNDDAGQPDQIAAGTPVPSGFYWTEGRRGVGLVSGAVPTLKGGSTVGAPSAPAVWLPSAAPGRRIVTPIIEDAEELQGLERGWTSMAAATGEPDPRWKLVGNAVTVSVAQWVGDQLAKPPANRFFVASPRDPSRAWPEAAFGQDGQTWSAAVSRWPVRRPGRPLEAIVSPDSAKPLSHRATRGFLSRIEESGIELPTTLMKDLESHLAVMRDTTAPAKQLWATTPEIRSRMKAVKSANTGPETRLRRALTDRGIRYRLQTRPEQSLRWRSDFVLKGLKIAIEVRGCFWHVCPIHQTWPKANADRWAAKLEKHQERDRRMESELTSRGWRVIVVWEHEGPEAAADRIQDAIRQRKSERPERGVRWPAS